MVAAGGTHAGVTVAVASTRTATVAAMAADGRAAARVVAGAPAGRASVGSRRPATTSGDPEARAAAAASTNHPPTTATSHDVLGYSTSCIDTRAQPRDEEQGRQAGQGRQPSRDARCRSGPADGAGRAEPPRGPGRVPHRQGQHGGQQERGAVAERNGQQRQDGGQEQEHRGCDGAHRCPSRQHPCPGSTAPHQQQCRGQGEESGGSEAARHLLGRDAAGGDHEPDGRDGSSDAVRDRPKQVRSRHGDHRREDRGRGQQLRPHVGRDEHRDRRGQQQDRRPHRCGRDERGQVTHVRPGWLGQRQVGQEDRRGQQGRHTGAGRQHLGSDRAGREGTGPAGELTGHDGQCRHPQQQPDDPVACRRPPRPPDGGHGDARQHRRPDGDGDPGDQVVARRRERRHPARGGGDEELLDRLSVPARA